MMRQQLVAAVLCSCVVLSHSAPWRSYDARQSQVCGDKLADMLSLICSGRGYNFAFKPEGSNARRFRRGIVEECCRRSCSPALLELYCRADPTEPPSNVQIRKRSDSEIENSAPLSHEEVPTSTKPAELTVTNTRNSEASTAKGTGEHYRIINLLSSTQHDHKSKASVSKSAPNDTTEEEVFTHNVLRHHNHHHHARRKPHGRKTTPKAKKDKKLVEGSTKTFEIGTVKPYFAGRPYASYRGSYPHPSLS